MEILTDVTALAPNMKATFEGAGGVAPYTYSLADGGPGGSINEDGLYTAPVSIPSDITRIYETIYVSDSANAFAQAQVLITNHFGLLCEIIQKELNLSSNRVFMWNQKILEPKDSGLYIMLSMISQKVFGNSLSYDSSGNAIQTVNMRSMIGVNIKSRSNEAERRKEEVLFALSSHYSRQQQERNNFHIAPVTSNITNLSEIDGSAIPYRYHFDLNMIYGVMRIKESEYYENYQDINLEVES